MKALDYEFRLVLTAIGYFTRLPIPRWVGYSDRQLNDASRYFPLVGILVGLFTGAVFLLGLRVLPQPIAVLLSMLAGILLTGAFHEDGLADTCDGFGGGRDHVQILAIMKDSRVGSYGVLGIAFTLLLKFAALAALPVHAFLAVSTAAHGFSRFMAVSMIYTQRYVREDDSARAKPAAQSLSRGSFACAGLLTLVPLVWLGAGAAVAAAVAIVLRIAAANYFYRRIGGYTGDCLGAVQQVAEIGFYLGFLAWIST
jgi:adenosylcobinamide-GDP ribazoletransferase